MKKRKLVALLTAGLAASMLFVACGGGANNTAQGNGNGSESGGTTKDLSKPERILVHFQMLQKIELIL